MHGVEVVDGALRDGSLDGRAFWARLLNRGHRLTAVGGSDEHTVDAPLDQNLGTPATVVFARELSEAGIVEGLKSGRVYIRTQHPRGPALEFSAESGGAVYQMGDTIPAAPPGGVTLQVELRAADGQSVEWMRNGEPFAAQPVGAGRLRRMVEARDGDWFSVVVRDAAGRVTVFANAIYIGRRQPTRDRDRRASVTRRPQHRHNAWVALPASCSTLPTPNAPPGSPPHCLRLKDSSVRCLGCG